MASPHVINVNDANFPQEVLQSPVPVLVDFWAEWCPPCKMIGPMIDELAAEYAGKAKVCKVNVDEASGLAVQFGIQSIPTIFVFKNGQPVDQVLGAKNKAFFKQMLDRALA